MRRQARYTTLATMVSCGLLPAWAAAGPLPDSFTLGRYLPGDVWFYIHGVHNPERAWLDHEWAEVEDAFQASGIDRDITSLILSAFGEERRADAQATLDKWSKLLKRVSWCDLIGREFAFAEHFVGKPVGVIPEYFILTRGSPDSASANVAGLVAILKELAALSDDFSVSKREVHGVPVWSLACCGEKKKEFPFSLELFRKGDVIGLSTGPAPLERVVALLTGASEEPSMIATPRFREALRHVDAPEDLLMFFDAKAFSADMRGLMKKATASADPQSNAKELRFVGAILKALDLLNVVDYTIVTVETQGRRELTHNVARLQPAKQKCTLVSCCLDRKPFERFDRFIPVDATGFNLTGFVDLEGLYKLALDFIKDEIPQGPALIEKWNGVLASIGFDPQEDLLSWWSGEMISVTLPPAVVTPMGGADWVWMVRVKNRELASKKMTAAVDALSGLLQGHGQMLLVTPAAVDGAEGFRQVTHPALAMFLHPVVGVQGEWLTVGSSAGAISRCLKVAAGNAPSIMQNERFKKEGLVPTGPVLSASFRDTSRFGEELGAAVGMAGMFGGMISGMIQGPGAEEGKEALQKIMTIVMKLGPVLQKLDFYSSESSVTTYDGAMTVRTEKVVAYKPPAAETVKTAGAE